MANLTSENKSGKQSRVVAIIPARGGSRRVPRKNLLNIAGAPLIVHTVRHAIEASAVDDVYVTTDDGEIARVASEAGAKIISRPAELAVDTATSESALTHALDTLREKGGDDPELVVFLQCTSPVRRSTDIDAAVAALRGKSADSLLSGTRSSRFIWAARGGSPQPINYDYEQRPREQDFEPQYYENGSIYVFKSWVLRKFNNRLGGKKAIFEMDYWSSFQIDTPADAQLCDWILRNHRDLAPQ